MLHFKLIKAKNPDEVGKLAADIFESGIVLTGGGSILKGLGKLINAHTEICSMPMRNSR